MMGSLINITVVVKKCRAGVEDRPYMVYYFSMRFHHVEIEPIRILALEVPEKRLTKAGRLHHTANTFSSEEGMKFRDGSVEGLGGGSALEFKVHLFGTRASAVVGGGSHESGELFGVEGRILDRGVAEYVREGEREREREKGRERDD